MRTKAREVSLFIKDKDAVEKERLPFAGFREAARAESEMLQFEGDGRRPRKLVRTCLAFHAWLCHLPRR